MPNQIAHIYKQGIRFNLNRQYNETKDLSIFRTNLAVL